jgi:predicted GNAT family N-acyltransferase
LIVDRLSQRGDNCLIGYYTLASGSVSRTDVPKRVAQGLGNYPVPITLLARLAVDLSQRGNGLGKGLLKNALLRAFQAAEIVGSRAIVTQAKDDAAKSFYQKFDLFLRHSMSFILIF